MTVTVSESGTSAAGTPVVTLLDLENALTAVQAGLLPVAGGTLTGPLTLAASPTMASQAATKAYVDASAASLLPLAGGTMAGPLFLASDPAISTQAATKNYVDNHVSKSALLPAADFSGSYGYSTQVSPGGVFMQQSQTVGSEAPFQLGSWIETLYHADAALAVDYPGAYLATVPLGLFVQHEAIGTSTVNNAGTVGIMSYGVNNAAGNNDCVAVLGRVQKVNVAGGIGDSCGVFGSAYNESLQTGGVIGVEAAIYQNVPGITPLDGLGNHWSAALHATSASTGGPASAGLAIDGMSAVSGFYGFNNGIIIDANCFAAIGTPANAGTVGINCGTWTSYYGPRYGIKFGPCQCHIFSTDQLNLQSNTGTYFDQRTNGTGAGVIFDMDTQTGSNVLFRSGGDDPGGANDILQVFGDIKAVNCTNLLTTKIFAITSSLPPVNSTAEGVLGQVEWDQNYLYICVAANSTTGAYTWRRVATSAF